MGFAVNIIFGLFIFGSFHSGEVANNFHLQKDYHEPRVLASTDLTQIARSSDMTRFNRILSNILVPRVVGTESHKRVREFIMSELKKLDFSVETQVSDQKTPLGELKFTNVIGRLNPVADRYLVLACHYDSKLMREGEFLGATDSAVPCAMMLDLAYALQDRLAQYKNSELSLMLLFFDGEEAFVNWGPTDSIYGARSLAEQWDSTSYPREHSTTNNLHRMDLLVLLDLLGAPRPTFFNYFKKTQKWYMQMASAEKRLTDQKLLKKSYDETYFFKMHLSAHIEDDHIPFIRRDVPCLHLIPTPFPDCWHKVDDNRNALDMDTIDNLNKIFRVFTLEYLQGSASNRVKKSTEENNPVSDL